MTSKTKKAKPKKARPGKPGKPGRPGRIDRLHGSTEHGSTEDDLLFLAEDTSPDKPARWSRPRKLRISLRVDTEVVDWFKALGPGYQTRINRILRKVMVEGKKRKG
jgi:uncharacterized protein (DUF4415 family)